MKGTTKAAPKKGAKTKKATPEQAMRDYMEDAWIAGKANIDYCEMVEEALHFVSNAVQDSGRSFRDSLTEQAQGGVDALRRLVYEKTNDAYRSLFMWAVVSDRPEWTEEAKRLAKTRFLRENVELMSLLDRRHRAPGGWSQKVDDGFRAQIMERMKEVKDLDPWSTRSRFYDYELDKRLLDPLHDTAYRSEDEINAYWNADPDEQEAMADQLEKEDQS